MHKWIAPLALLAFTTSLLAQSPFAGTWKLDTAKTKYSSGQPPKDVTLVIEEQGDNLQVTATGTNADGSPLSLKYTVPLKGGEGHLESNAYDSISTKMVSPTVRVNTYLKAGKVVTTRRIVVSKDGKTMTSTVKGLNLAGQTVTGTDVFDKQ